MWPTATVLAWLSGCAFETAPPAPLVASPPMEPVLEGGLPIPHGQQVTLTLEDGTVIEEWTWIQERAVLSDRDDCVSAVALTSWQPSAIWLFDPSFLNTQVGTATRPLTDRGVRWGGAGLAATDTWSGVLRIAAWTPERIALDLVDGRHCRLGATPASCTDTSGRVTIEGRRSPDDSARPVLPARDVDAATRTPLCAAGLRPRARTTLPPVAGFPERREP